jgi:acyl-[acyl-carrier-protein]-phospholipid O-acyltransferase/long-chain-fatty-acid--[acyl-carrier-protein] ligase
VSSNVAAFDQIVRLTPRDVVLGVLPFFHSFGYTVTLWCVLGIDIQGAYHADPTEARQVGKLAQRHAATILLATPTFLRGYLRRCEKEQLASVDVVVAGAEKLPIELCAAFEEKFGVRPVEGYGTTELSPLVSVNIPPSRSMGSDVDRKEGTVGRPIPNVAAKVVDIDSGAVLPAGQSGLLLVKGPNVMRGYLHRDDLTAEAIRDGWYATGDVAMIDQDGFITITDRQSRFSKIGGEMVPHIKIEESLAKLIGSIDEERPRVAVTSIPDARKGERLIVVHTKLEQSAEDLRQRLLRDGLPPLYVPSSDSFVEVPELPVLGSGKIDLKAIKEMALAAFEVGCEVKRPQIGAGE